MAKKIIIDAATGAEEEVEETPEREYTQQELIAALKQADE